MWVFLTFLLILGIYLFIIITTKYWNGRDKFNFVFKGAGESIEVLVLDPRLSEITVLTIPGDTEVEVARNYGTLRLKNVWQLGVNEKLGGELLSSTVMKNFLFPVFLWTDTDISIPFKFVFFPGKTNIPFGDRLNAALFVLKIGRSERTEIDLAKSQFLRKETLRDGQPGYRGGGVISERLTIYFADEDFSQGSLRIYFRDAGGVFGVAEKMGEILEVMGGKVIAVDKAEVSDSDCEVSGNELAARKVANLFSCRVVKDQAESDIEIKMGKRFAERF